MSNSIDYSFEDMGRNPVPANDPMVLKAMYNSGTKPGEDAGTKAEKAAYKAYYEKQEAKKKRG